MNTPTEQAMRAAEAAAHPSMVEAAKRHPLGENARLLMEMARRIDTATDLPTLIAERDALRKALELAQPYIKIEAGVIHKAIADAIALSSKGQP